MISQISCKYDKGGKLLDCSNKSWDELLYLTEAAGSERGIPAREIRTSFRNLTLIITILILVQVSILKFFRVGNSHGHQNQLSAKRVLSIIFFEKSILDFNNKKLRLLFLVCKKIIFIFIIQTKLTNKWLEKIIPQKNVWENGLFAKSIA